MDRAKFGPSGNSYAFYDAKKSKTEESAVWVKDMGLDCFEYSFGRGINMKDERALELNKAFKDNGITISVHAPYYINLANPEEENAKKSFNYIIESAKKLKLLGGDRLVIHPACQGKESRDTAFIRTLNRVKALREEIYAFGLSDVKFCFETMGKLGQIGTVEEITEICKCDKAYIPTVDFGHVNAREQGSLKAKQDYLDRLNYMIDNLGYEKMKYFHVHFSKIEYTERGESKHLTFEDKIYGPEFYPLAEALCELKLFPFVICESAGTQDADALTIKKIYEGVIK